MKNIINARIDAIIEIIDQTLQNPSLDVRFGYSRAEQFNYVMTASKSLTLKIYGENHPYYIEISGLWDRFSDVRSFSGAKGILTAIKEEIESGLFMSFKGVISAEIFSDFLEMASHLLEEGYYIPAAVMIGSVLEEHLTNMCISNKIDTVFESKDGKRENKKASTKNEELYKNKVYNQIEQKAITAWLSLRNSAAHGKYDEFDISQVKIMHQGVFDFIMRHPL